MKIYATKRVTKGLSDNGNKDFLDSFQKAMQVITKSANDNTLNSDLKIQKLNISEQPIFSFRIDKLTRLIFTITIDENNEIALTLLDIARHADNIEAFVSGSTRN